jgi:hypothetical protein
MRGGAFAVAAGALIGAVAIAVVTSSGKPQAAPPVSASPVQTQSSSAAKPTAGRRPHSPDVGRVRSVKSRFVSQRVLEIWGRTSAPDGATVRIRIHGATTATAVIAPTAQGRFYVREELPAALQGQRLRVDARIRG